MFQVLPAGTHLFRVTEIARTWQDVVSGVGSYYVTGGRYNRVQQRTVYASRIALVSIAETAVHIGVDRWQPRIGQGFLAPQPPLPPPPLPLVSEHRLWEFTVDVDMQLIRVERQAAIAQFNYGIYEVLNPSQAYRRTADLADAIRLHPHPIVPNAFVDGLRTVCTNAARESAFPASRRSFCATKPTSHSRHLRPTVADDA